MGSRPPRPYEQRATDAVDSEQLVSDLRSLIRIPSVTGDESAVARWLAGSLRDMRGVRVEELAPDLAGVRGDPDWPGEEMDRSTLPIVLGRLGRAGGRRILLVGHTDVVPIGDRATWSVDPGAPRSCGPSQSERASAVSTAAHSMRLAGSAALVIPLRRSLYR